MNQLTAIDSRLKQMLINDKKDNPTKLIGIIKSEIFYVLKNYMDIKIDDIDFNIGIDNRHVKPAVKRHCKECTRNCLTIWQSE